MIVLPWRLTLLRDRLRPKRLETLRHSGIAGHHTMVLCLRPIEDQILTAAIEDRAAGFLDHEYTRANVPFMNGSERERAITIATRDFCQAKGNTTNRLNRTAVEKDLEFPLRLRSTDQKQCAVDLGAT